MKRTVVRRDQEHGLFSLPLLKLAHPSVVHLEDSKQSLEQGANFHLYSKTEIFRVLTF